MTNIANFFKSVKSIQLIGPMDFDYQKVNSELPTIFVDGGLNHSKHFSIKNSISIGDNDSANELEVDILFPKEKDSPDLALALELIDKEAKEGSSLKLSLLGFLNGRKDHELSNLLESTRFLNNKRNSILNFEENICIVSRGLYKIDSLGIFSLFSLEENILSLNGDCKYSLDNSNIKPFSGHGLSNEIKGEVTLNCTSPLIIYFSNGFKINLEN